MVNVTLNDTAGPAVDIEIDDGMDWGRTEKVARRVIEKNMGKTVSDGPQPDWVQANPMFSDPDMTCEEFEREIADEIEQYCGQES